MKFILTIIILLSLFFVTASTNAVSAQVYKFDAGSVTQPIPLGSTFQVKILINTAGEQVINGDSLLTFDPAKVSIDSATTGNFMTYYSATPLGGSTNKYLVSSWEESVAHAKSSTTDVLFATLNLTAKAVGTATLAFDCTSGTEADSNINRASDAVDIIKCDTLAPLSLNIGSGGNGNGTATPTVAPTVGTSPTSAPTPTAILTSTPVPTVIPTTEVEPTATSIPPVSELPRSGMVEVTFAALGIGLLLTTVGVLFIL